MPMYLVFSELAVHTESKMIFFYDWTAVKLFASASKSEVSVVNVVHFPARITVSTVKLIRHLNIFDEV